MGGRVGARILAIRGTNVNRGTRDSFDYALDLRSPFATIKRVSPTPPFVRFSEDSMSRIVRPLFAFVPFIAFALLFGPLAGAQDKKDEKKEPAKTDVKKEETKKVELKKEETKKEEPKKTDNKKDEPKQDEPKKEEPKKEEPKKEPFVPDAPLTELKGHTGGILGVAYLDGGKTIVSLGRDRTLRIWDVDSKKEKSLVKDLADSSKGLAVGGGKIYVSAGKWNKEKKGWEGEIKILDAGTGKQAGALKGHGETITSLFLSKDGKILASASEDQLGKLWDLGASKEGVGFKGHGKAIHAIALTADGTKAATASADGSVKLWNVADGKELASIKYETETKKPDPKTKKDVVTKSVGRDFTSLAFSPDGKKLVAGNLDGEIVIIDVDAGKEIAKNKGHDGVWAVAFSPDGSNIATGGWDQTIKVWDASGKELNAIKAHLGTVTAIVFSPDNQFIASGGFDGLVKIWPANKK
jgi:WD40 repeat protein